MTTDTFLHPGDLPAGLDQTVKVYTPSRLWVIRLPHLARGARSLFSNIAGVNLSLCRRWMREKISSRSIVPLPHKPIAHCPIHTLTYSHTFTLTLIHPNFFRK